MSGISTSIQVQDRVSGAINRIISSLYDTTAAFERVDRASETTFNTAGVQAMTRELYTYEARIESIEGELVQARSRLEQMERQTEENTSAANRLGDSFGSIGSIIAGLGLGLLIKQQIGSAISYASDLQEVQNVVDTTFAEGSEAVNKWSQTTLEAFGLNELSAKQFSGTMGAMLKSSGLAGDTVQDMAMKITELSGDMASFYNLDAEEAFNKIRSGISGETEPLKQLGINMSVANLEAYALSQGIEKSYQEMSQAEQVTLRYNYLLAATADAQGDFSRTSGSYANQIKMLKENWQGFTGELAANVLPLLAYGIGILNNAIGFISNNWNVIGPVVAGLAGAVTVITAVALAIKVAAGVTAIWNAILAMNPIVLIVAAVVALIGVIVALCNWIASVTGIAESGIGVVCGALATAGAFVYNNFLALLDLVLGIVNYWYNIFASFANFFANVFVDPIGSIIQLFGNMADNVLGIIESIAKAIDKVFGSNLASAVSGWRGSLSSKIEVATSKYGNGKYEEVMGNLNLSSSSLGLDRLSYGDAFNAGAKFGDGVAEKVSDKVDSLKNLGSGVDTLGGAGGLGSNSVANNTGKTADNTGKMVDSVDISNENLKYMRDIAEREVINRFTTAEIKVDMKNNNNINNSMDIDGIVKQLTDGVTEAMEQAAEGVHK